VTTDTINEEQPLMWTLWFGLHARVSS